MEAVEEGKYLSMFSSLMTELQGTLLLATRTNPSVPLFFHLSILTKMTLMGSHCTRSTPLAPNAMQHF